MERLSVRFSDRVKVEINNLSSATGASSSDVARAAIAIGLDKMGEMVGKEGTIIAKGWIAALNGKVK